MDLYEARVGKPGAAFVGAIGSTYIAGLGVGRGLLSAGDISRLHLAVDLRRVDDGHDAARQAAEER